MAKKTKSRRTSMRKTVKRRRRNRVVKRKGVRGGDKCYDCRANCIDNNKRGANYQYCDLQKHHCEQLEKDPDYVTEPDCDNAN